MWRRVDERETFLRILANGRTINRMALRVTRRWTCNQLWCNGTLHEGDAGAAGTAKNRLCAHCGGLHRAWYEWHTTVVRRGLYTLWRMMVLGKRPWGGGYKDNPIASQAAVEHLVYLMPLEGASEPTAFPPLEGLIRVRVRIFGSETPLSSVRARVLKTCRRLQRVIAAGGAERAQKMLAPKHIACIKDRDKIARTYLLPVPHQPPPVSLEASQAQKQQEGQGQEGQEGQE